jgi:hypothetical protein
MISHLIPIGGASLMSQILLILVLLSLVPQNLDLLWIRCLKMLMLRLWVPVTQGFVLPYRRQEAEGIH